MTTKPRLTLAEARYFCDVDAYIRQVGYKSGLDLEQAFSDQHDGRLYRKEIDGLIRQRLLRIIPLNERPGSKEYDCGLMGYAFTVDLTDRAMLIFWPKLYAKRRKHAAPQSRGGRARAAKLSPERRAEIARTAALARWNRQ